jgi:hypothetical protein
MIFTCRDFAGAKPRLLEGGNREGTLQAAALSGNVALFPPSILPSARLGWVNLLGCNSHRAAPGNPGFEIAISSA